MKKIIAMLLAVVCLAALLVSCGEPSKTAPFTEAIKNTNPTTAVINTTTVDARGELSGQYTATFAEDGSFTVVYSYERWLAINEGAADEVKKTESGTVTCDANGNYTNGASFTGTLPALTAGVAINVEAISSEVKFSGDGNTLIATVAAANTEAVFGTAYTYDITLTVVKGEAAIESVTLAFDNAGVKGSIVCVYN